MFTASRCVLKALTDEARLALQGDAMPIDRFPFRVGRESRDPNSRPSAAILAQRRRGLPPNNDLYIRETGAEVFVSREHFQIELAGDGYYLVDCASTLGTWVEGRLIGTDRRGGKAPLQHGDVVILGSFRSGLIFKFLVDAG